MYKAMYQLLTGHAPLTDLIPADSIYERGSVIDKPPLPYAVMVWMPSAQKASGRFVRIFELHVHDEVGSQSRLRDVTAVVSALLKGVVQYQGSDGYLTECSFIGDGGELVESDSLTNLQFTTWEVVGRKTS